MMFMLWLVVLAIAIYSKRRHRRTVKLLYRGQARIDVDTAIFPCGCRFSLVDPDLRTLCAAHNAIITAEVSA